MSFARIGIKTGLAILLCSATAGFARDTQEDIRTRMGAGNPAAGKEKSTLCQGCHGERGVSTESVYPKLAGQYAAYIQKQIKNFQAGSRKDPLMSDMAATVTDEQDLLDISAYFASRAKMKGDMPVINENGRVRFFGEGNGCINCHGVNGKGLAPDNPTAPVIGGQHKDYLVKQIKDFRSGSRSNDPGNIMGWITSQMSDSDIEDVASYISGL